MNKNKLFPAVNIMNHKQRKQLAIKLITKRKFTQENNTKTNISTTAGINAH